MAANTKYVTVKVSGVIIAIGKELEPGYSETIIEAFLPSDEELETWLEERTDEWIKDNNKRMEAICKYMNKQQL